MAMSMWSPQPQGLFGEPAVVVRRCRTRSPWLMLVKKERSVVADGADAGATQARMAISSPRASREDGGDAAPAMMMEMKSAKPSGQPNPRTLPEAPPELMKNGLV